MPAVIPVTAPELEPTIALPLLMLQLPLPPSVNTTVEPTHTLNVPEIADGKGLTVTIQPVLKV